MAKMGQRRMSETKKAESERTLPTLGVVVVMPMLQIETTMPVVIGSTLGVPIMREGFVTETGLLPPSMLAATAIMSLSLARN